jgi:uncharacterized protein
MLKTVRGCNLACSYCYTADSALPHVEIMDVGLATDIIAQQMALVAGKSAVSFGWQGGEPTLAGLPFFEQIVAAEARYAPDGTVISNDLQTNGVLIDDSFADFLATYKFLVGLSLDGPRHLQDAARKDKAGRGSFGRTMAAFERLALRGVDVNALCVVGPHNIKSAPEVLGFFAAQGFTHVQLVPAMGFGCNEPSAYPKYLVSASQYGGFLCELLQAWMSLREPRPCVQVIDDALRASSGQAPAICTHANTCDAGLVIDTNGDVYPCDFYQSALACLGNLHERPLLEMWQSARLPDFASRKGQLPAACRACSWLCLCRGGCPRNRPSDSAPDALCEAYGSFYGKMDEMGLLKG